MKNIKVESLKAKVFLAFYETLIKTEGKIKIIVDNSIMNDQFLKAYENSMRFVILNIGPKAVTDFKISDEEISFNSTFNLMEKHIVVKMIALDAVILPVDEEGIEKTYFFPSTRMLKLKNKNIFIDEPIPSENKLKLVKENQTDNKVIDFNSARKKREDQS